MSRAGGVAEDFQDDDVDGMSDAEVVGDSNFDIGNRRRVGISDPDDGDVGDDIPVDLALRRVLAASQLSAKHRAFEVGPYVEALARSGYHSGFDTQTLTSLIHTFVSPSSTLDRSAVTTLLKNLYPRGLVPADPIVIAIVGSLGPGSNRIGAATQVLLIRWLVLVYDFIDDQNVLAKLYGVLFGLLDAISIRAPLCQLLGLVTRRRHVRKYRVQQLLELCYKTGNEPCLVGLLRTFKDFYPEIVMSSNLVLPRSTFRHPDPDWRSRLVEIHLHDAAVDDGSSSLSNRYRVADGGASGFRLVRSVHSTINRNGSIVPTASSAATAVLSQDTRTVTLEEIDSAKSLVRNVGAVVPPAQVVSVLRDPLVQKLLLIKGDNHEMVDRLDAWLGSLFNRELAAAKNEPSSSSNGRGQTRRESRELASVLDALVPFTRFFGEIMPVVRRFLTAYVQTWNGVDSAGPILSILAYLPIQHFDDLHTSILGPLEDAVLAHPRGHYAIITFYRRLLLHWATVVGTAIAPSFFSQSQSQSHSHSGLNSPPVTAESERQIHALVNHVSTLAVAAVAVDGPDPAAVSAIQLFYQATPFVSNPNKFPPPSSPSPDSTSSHQPIPTISLPFPPPSLVFHFIVSPRLADICAASSILSSYKPVLANRPVPIENEAQTFNSLLLEVSDLFWRSRAFCGPSSSSTESTSANARHSNIRPDTRDKIAAWLVEHSGPFMAAAVPTSATSPTSPARSHKNDLLADAYSSSRHPALSTMAEWVFYRYLHRKVRESRGSSDGIRSDHDTAALERADEAASKLRRQMGGISKQFVNSVAKSQGLDMDWIEYRVEFLDWLAEAGATGLTDLLKGTMRGLRKDGRRGYTPSK